MVACFEHKRRTLNRYNRPPVTRPFPFIGSHLLDAPYRPCLIDTGDGNYIWRLRYQARHDANLLILGQFATVTFPKVLLSSDLMGIGSIPLLFAELDTSILCFHPHIGG